MTYTETHTLAFAKPTIRGLQHRAVDGQMTSLIESVMTQGIKVRGWSMEKALTLGDDGTFYGRDFLNPDENAGNQYDYRMYAILHFERADGAKPGGTELASVLRTLAQRSEGQAFGRWTLAMVDGAEYVKPGDDDDEISANVNADLIGYVDVQIPDDFETHFSHLFGRDAHIARIRAALEAAIMSNWNSRFNVALAGPPGCGKSDICASLKRALGEDAVLEFDATATTGAGAIKELSERDILPRVLIVEEIEKTDEKSLNYLMSLCDIRGEIRKTTARAQIQRNVKMLVIATVNDLDGFRKMASGALASRFANVIGFSRPSREQLAMILTREVQKIGGDDAWIAPALDYCEQIGETDPRAVIALCLCGRDKLVTGEYQKMLAETAIV